MLIMLLAVTFSAIKIKPKGKRPFNNWVSCEGNIHSCVPPGLPQGKITLGPQPFLMAFCLPWKAFPHLLYLGAREGKDSYALKSK